MVVSEVQLICFSNVYLKCYNLFICVIGIVIIGLGGNDFGGQDLGNLGGGGGGGNGDYDGMGDSGFN